MKKIIKENIYIFMTSYIVIYILFLFGIFSIKYKENISFYIAFLTPIIIVLLYFAYKEYKIRKKTKIEIENLFISSYKNFFTIITIETIFFLVFMFLLNYYLELIRYEKENYQMIMSMKSSFMPILIFSILGIYIFKTKEVFYKFCNQKYMEDLNKYVINRVRFFNLSNNDINILINSKLITDTPYIQHAIKMTSNISNYKDLNIKVKHKNILFKINNPLEKFAQMKIIVDDKIFYEFDLMDYLNKNNINFEKFISSKDEMTMYEIIKY